MQNEGGSDHTGFEEDVLESSTLGDNEIQIAGGDTQQNMNMFSVPQTPTMKRKQRNVDSQLVSKHLKQASDVLQSLVKKPNVPQNQKVTDGPELFAQLLAEKLRQLSPRTRLLLEHKIDNLVFEALIQEMDSQTQNHTPRSIIVPSPCSSLESYISPGSTYSTHQFSHTPSPYEEHTSASYTQPLTANHVYLQPSQPQHKEGINITVPHTQSSTNLGFYGNAEEFVDGNQTGNDK